MTEEDFEMIKAWVRAEAKLVSVQVSDKCDRAVVRAARNATLAERQVRVALGVVQ